MKSSEPQSPFGKLTAERLMVALMRDGYARIATDPKDPNYSMQIARSDFRLVLLLARKVKPSAKVIDSIIAGYIIRAAEYTVLQQLFNLPSPAFPLRLARCGATKEMIEYLAHHFAKTGFLELLAETTRLIGRNPTPHEVRLAALHFIKGPDRSAETKQDLLDFTRRYLPEDANLEKAIREHFD